MSMSVPSSLSMNPTDVDADQQMGGDKVVIPVAVIAGGVGGLALLIVVVVVVVVLLRRRCISAFVFLQLFHHFSGTILLL